MGDTSYGGAPPHNHAQHCRLDNQHPHDMPSPMLPHRMHILLLISATIGMPLVSQMAFLLERHSWMSLALPR